MSTGRFDNVGVLIEEMDVVQVGMEVGVVVYNQSLDAFLFANDFLVKELSEIENIRVLMKHTKVDDWLDSIMPHWEYEY